MIPCHCQLPVRWFLWVSQFLMSFFPPLDMSCDECTKTEDISNRKWNSQIHLQCEARIHTNVYIILYYTIIDNAQSFALVWAVVGVFVVCHAALCASIIFGVLYTCYATAYYYHVHCIMCLLRILMWSFPIQFITFAFLFVEKLPEH